MENKNKVSIKNRLFFKIYLNYAIILTLFAVLLGVIYMRLYSSSIMDTYHNQLIKQARTVSKKLAQTIRNKEEGSYLEYFAILEEVNDGKPDIWTISNPNSQMPMNKSLENVDLEDINLPEDCLTIMNKAFSNQVDFTMGYYEEFGGMSIIMGVPVEVYGEVVGIVLLISQVSEQEQLVSESMRYIIMSGMVTIFISFIIAMFFAKGISSPISKMRLTALRLADGGYDSRLKINRKDEIGDLARTIDILAQRLEENEEERQNAEQMRIDFFANVSHELRTPITVIRAYTESLVDRIITDEEKIDQYYLRILSECKGMERLVGDLLLLSKMQNPDFVIEKEPINIVQVFDDLGRSILPICEGKGIQVSIYKDSPSYMMMGDYDRLRQMFLIILDNAIKFSHENSTVHVTLSKEDKLKISIKDEGVGIATEELPIIFVKFYKSKLKQNQQGSGLGLAIAKQIAMKHDGSVEVFSTLGKGTEFVFQFQCLENYVEELNM